MKLKLIFLIMLVSLASFCFSQVDYIPVSNNRRFIDTTSIDRLGVNVSLGEPARPFHVVADTVRFQGLDGTGSFMKKINADGDFILTKIRKSDISELDPYEVVYGDPGGSGEAYQNNNITMGGHSEIGVAPNYMFFETDGEGGIVMYEDFALPNYSRFYYNEVGVLYPDASTIMRPNDFELMSQAKTITIKRPYTSGGTSYTIELPSSPGTSSQYLSIGSVAGTILSTSWTSLPAIPSVTLDNYQIAVGDGTGIVGFNKFVFNYDANMMALYEDASIFITDDISDETQIESGSISFTNGSSSFGVYPTGFDFISPLGGVLTIGKTDGADTYSLYMPNSQGSSGETLVNDGTGNLTWGVPSGFAPDDAEYITYSSNASLSNEKVLTEGSAIDITSGASTVTLSLDINELTQESSISVSDEALIYDNSETANNKVVIEDLAAVPDKPSFRDYRYQYYNELINTVSTATAGSGISASSSGTSAASSTSPTSASNRVGLVRSTTGTTATGRTGCLTGAGAVRLGGGVWTYEAELSIGALSTVTERYQLLVGFIDVLSAANQTDGVYFLYDEGGVSTGSAASANWQQVSSSNSVRTFTTTSTAVGTSFVNLKIEVDGSGNATFYINGVAMPTVHSTNVPTAANRETGFGWLLIKSVGTTARVVDFDYISTECDFTTPR